MIDSNLIEQVIGQSVHGRDGDKLGKVGQVYLDDETGKPEWATVQTGLFGNRESFVPLAQADLTDDGLSVPYAKDQVKDAPSVDVEQGHLSPEEEAQPPTATTGWTTQSGAPTPACQHKASRETQSSLAARVTTLPGRRRTRR